jgi:chorismate mutase
MVGRADERLLEETQLMTLLNLDILPLTTWLPNAGRPLIISGPCGAETEEQVMATARGIASLNRVSIFRAGIWKPRTRPNSFEGVGRTGLSWLRRVKAETGLLTAVEVANAHHVEEALNNGVDILWIGARTTVNPFSVQEIADAIKGTDIPVMVKNPLHADIQLWIGALERVNNAGIKKLIAVHRGFFSTEKKKYRNAPLWEIPIELKAMCPQLPIICDPSHISGRVDLLQQVSQKALDLDMSGLIIESHINPKAALSDAKQQVTPAELNDLLNSLTLRETTSDNEEFTSRLQQLRSLIDEIDEDIIRTMGKRMEVIEKIGEYKRDNNVTILQIERWLEILRTRTDWGEAHGFSADFIKKLCQLVHKESIRKQTDIMNSPKIEK